MAGQQAHGAGLRLSTEVWGMNHHACGTEVVKVHDLRDRCEMQVVVEQIGHSLGITEIFQEV